MASTGTDNILDSAKRMRMPPQRQRSQNQVHPPPSTSRHPPLASIQAGHVQFHPSSSSGVQTQTQAPQDTSGTRVDNIPHANVSQGGNVSPSSSIGSLLRHYPPSSFQPNNYPGYTLSQQPPPFPTAHPPTYPYTHARGYAPHFPLESGPYQQNLPGFGPMIQARSPYHTGGLPYTLGSNSGMHSTASSPTTHSPLPVQQPPPGASGSLQYQPVRYPSPYTPYRYNHAYQPNPYQWHYHSPVPPGFNEGIPMHYQPQYQINFPPSQDSPSSDLETHFSQVSIRGSPTSPVQSTASSAVLPVRHLPQVALTAPSSLSASNSPKIFARTEGHASPSRPPKVNSPSCSHSERPAVRRPHHPNPPSHKSEWVMWIGNVPGGTTHDELWRFLKRPPVDDDSFESEDNGISSIFLISRSNCAFVNFNTEEHLRRAIVQFNGQHLHPHERRGPRLVCRVRRKEDDLRAGVGGQRGVGMHTRYIREQSQQGQMDNQVTPSEDDRSSSTGRRSSLSSESGNPLAVAAPQSMDEEAARAHQGSQPGDSVKAQSNSSYASTNSSFLSRHFPKRFFILKSLTQFDLDLSVKNGLWATQKHNEAILDQAYRTSSDVILIFSVNKSGEFYGYAHMAGRILKGEHRVSWASHADPSATSVSSSRREPGSPSPHVATDHSFFTPSENRLVEESPMPFTPHSGGSLSSKPSPMEPHRSSAPAALGPCPPREESSAKKLNLRESRKAMTATGLISRDFVNVTPEIVLDKNAPVRALRNQESTDGTKSVISALQSVEEENNSIGSDDGNTGEEQQRDDVMPSMAENAGNDEQQAWGQPFKVEWLCTERLPFYSTRHLRNPWNQDREIKVSRDGTEVEPGVGQQLLEQWRTLAAAPVVMETSKSPAAVDQRAAKPTSTLPPATVNSGNCGQS
ncbi:YT521-B-like domain-containing protein [Suillus fuscotomentosus]|uniref:YT521-B-like domain-containing protein n=1 Tax=Suillus fuscotomentosus TaxID=1912939 RepID=A0AAD4HQC5_9AGAM|nr:YT521-B-like domain-containing protein [Suillus fuscotomentosus]KAG1905113.1 YT521-B-like domain-containing protein [Suillus fuscotomentosus]